MTHETMVTEAHVQAEIEQGRDYMTFEMRNIAVTRTSNAMMKAGRLQLCAFPSLMHVQAWCMPQPCRKDGVAHAESAAPPEGVWHIMYPRQKGAGSLTSRSLM